MTLKEYGAAFMLNACYPTAADIMSPIRGWAKRRVKNSVKQLAPLAVKAFAQAYPEIYQHPQTKIYCFPAKQQDGTVDVEVFGYHGFCAEALTISMAAGVGMSDCVLKVDKEGQVVG